MTTAQTIPDHGGPASIIGQTLPEVRLAFAGRIDLMDETIREGAERASVAPTLAEKADLVEHIAAIGVRSIVVGMFPDVPHNIALLKELVTRQAQGSIAQDVRFLIISHVGITFEQTLHVLRENGIPTRSVWILLIHSVSDQQMRHMFPTILKKDAGVAWDEARWEAAGTETIRADNLKWLDDFLPNISRFDGAGVMLGLLDAFRSDRGHLVNVCRIAQRHGIGQVRLADTAGTCLPQQIGATVAMLIGQFPQLGFYGHFHDDFGMATANAMMGLSVGLQGVDVSVGGFANRSGHPPLAEVAMGLRRLYGVELPGFRYEDLYALSRRVEHLYGLMENPAQAITGPVTYSIQTGIRTELLRKAPTIFDIVDPREVGASLTRMFGVRSGRDGLLRFLKEDDKLKAWGIEPTAEIADRLYPALEAEWCRRSEEARDGLRTCIATYQRLLQSAFFTEEEVATWLRANADMLTIEQMETV